MGKQMQLAHAYRGKQAVCTIVRFTMTETRKCRPTFTHLERQINLWFPICEGGGSHGGKRWKYEGGWKTTGFFFHNFSLSPFASQLHFSLLKIFLRWKRRGGTNHASYNLLRSVEEWKSSPSHLKKFILHCTKL